jgi:surface antigen
LFGKLISSLAGVKEMLLTLNYSDPVAGHIAYVEKVYANGSFLVSEGNQKAEPEIRLVKVGTPVAAAAKFIYLQVEKM